MIVFMKKSFHDVLLTLFHESMATPASPETDSKGWRRMLAMLVQNACNMSIYSAIENAVFWRAPWCGVFAASSTDAPLPVAHLPPRYAMNNAIARRLEAIQTKGAMRSSDVANVLNVRPETVSRWNKGKALPHAGTEKQLLELEFVIDKLADIYEPHDARLWLFARQRLLDDQVPAELIQQGRVDEVLTSVNQLLDGVHL
jgi:hypothetical protein